MCELLGLSASHRIYMNDLMREFFSHGKDHPNGWGIALFFGNAVSLEKQAENACKSRYLKERLESPIRTDQMIAHIRYATKGGMQYDNTHPFVARDLSGRVWTFAHNGTIFSCDSLNDYLYRQQGNTDSERIFLYLIDRINDETHQRGRALSDEERCRVVEQVIDVIAPENKVNLLLFDSEVLYAHMNFRDSLYLSQERDPGEVIFSTTPLKGRIWEMMPLNTMLAFKRGSLIYRGHDHGCEFFETEEKMKHLMLDYAGL